MQIKRKGIIRSFISVKRWRKSQILSRINYYNYRFYAMRIPIPIIALLLLTAVLKTRSKLIIKESTLILGAVQL